MQSASASPNDHHAVVSDCVGGLLGDRWGLAHVVLERLLFLGGDIDLAVLHLGTEGVDVVDGWRVLNVAGAYVEASAMPWAIGG